MSDPVVEALILDLLEWLVAGERTYQDVMEAWRTSCPKLPVWEEANERELIAAKSVNGRKLIVASASGLLLLEKRRTLSPQRKSAHLA
jgi:D-3-phosphoglycerate dehydrogenase